MRHGVAITCRGLLIAQVPLAEVQPTIGAEGLSVDSDVASGQRTISSLLAMRLSASLCSGVFLLGRSRHGVMTKSPDHEGIPENPWLSISRLMALAIHCDELHRTGQVTNQSGLAEYAQITPARLTQILTLLNLSPDIQEQLLFLPRTIRGRGEIRELNLRRIAMELDWGAQWPRVGNS